MTEQESPPEYSERIFPAALHTDCWPAAQSNM